MVLICISLITNCIGHVFMWSFVFRVSSVVKCLFTSFAHYFIGWFFYYWVRRVLRICIYILGASPLRDVAVQLLSHFQIFCNPMDCSWQGSFVHGILQARILEWVAIFFYRGSSQPRDRTCASCLLYWQAGSWPLAPGGKPFLEIFHVKLYGKHCQISDKTS